MNLPTNSLELANNLNSHRSIASSYWQFFKNQSPWRTYWWFLVSFSSFLVSSILFSQGPSRPDLWHLFMTWVSISSNAFFFFFWLKYRCFPGGSDAGDSKDMGSIPCWSWIPGLQRSPGEEMAIHSSILACRILWTESMGSERLDVTEQHTHT